MSVQGLQNPYERLQVLPTTMNWRGTWLVTQTYFKNDVVISPVNGASYILTNQIALTGGADPSASASYSELSPLSTGILGITPGTAIGISGPANNPTITNNGVRTVNGDGTSIVVDNTDPNNPIITSNSITIIQQGQGISVDNTNPQIPVIGNTGVRQILPADGSVNVSNPTGIVSISSNGLVSLTQGLGISVDNTDPQNPKIANAGVISLDLGAGLSTTGGTNPTIANTGVLSVAPADTSIIVGGTAQNVTLRTAAPVLVRAFVFTFVAFPPAAPNTALSIGGGTPISPNIFRDYLANGAPDATGIFMIDMSEVILNFVAAGAGAVVQNVFYVAFFDGVLNHEYVSATILNNNYLTVGQGYPITTAVGMVYFNVADARATGMREVNQIRIYNNTNGSLVLQSAVPTFLATYWPSGLQ